MVLARALASFGFLGCCVTACGVLPGRGESGASGPPEGAGASAPEVLASVDDPALGEAALAASTADVCWKRTSVRGVGTIPTECPGAEKSGLLCYPLCPAGYKGVGPVCWQSCPAGYTDDGVTCRRDASIISSDNGGCPWYDKCGLTLARGCSKCPAGYANDGCTCRRDVHIFGKSTQPRGAGTPMSCAAGNDLDAGLCYARCDAGGRGVGPVCWMACAGDLAIECGAGCARSTEACARAISDQVLKPVETVASAVSGSVGEALVNGLATANAFRLPICGVQ
jgi:hypothetical protein